MENVHDIFEELTDNAITKKETQSITSKQQTAKEGTAETMEISKPSSEGNKGRYKKGFCLKSLASLHIF